MFALDTNVLVRLLVQDDLVQFERARRMVQREVGRGDAVLISLLVLMETEWVLRTRYSVPPRDIALGCRATATFDIHARKLPGFISP